MTTKSIELTQKGSIATLTINKPETRNAINQAMWKNIIQCLDKVAENKTIRVLIVTGSNSCFSAGADIKEFKQLASDNEKLKSSNDIIQLAQQKLEELPRPTIAKIDGACVGGGLGIALACDLRVASEKSTFAITPAKLGLIYSLRDTRRLLGIVGPPATKELLFTGKKIDSEQALLWRMLNSIETCEELDQKVEELAKQLSQSSQYSIRNIKKIISTLEGIAELDEASATEIFNDAFNSEDAKEGISAFMEKRLTQFTWG